MSAEIAQLWKPPCVASLAEGSRLFHSGHTAWLHSHFAYALFYTSKALPMKASAKTLALETARHVVRLNRDAAERALTANGFITRWSDEQCEAIACEMAEAMPRHPGVIEAVERALTNRRDEVFADSSLTRNDELFTVYQAHVSDYPEECHEQMIEDGVVVIKEDAIETIDRSLDYIRDLIDIGASRPFIPLRRILSSLRRVHDVVHIG